MIEDISFSDYYLESAKIGDIDPALKGLEYVSDRWEFTLEERYLLSFYYSTCYSSVTAYYMKNEFPDFKSLNMRRINSWWKENKKKCVFQTDRFKVKSMEKFPLIVESYISLITKEHSSQTEFFESFKNKKPTKTYTNFFDIFCKNLFYTGRFTCFIYLEALWRIAGLKNYPNNLNLSEAEACRNGLTESVSKRKYNTYYNKDLKITKEQLKELDLDFWKIYKEIKKKSKKFSLPFDIFKLETVFCAYYKYKKYPLEKSDKKIRYIGYYLDRELEEIQFMEENVKQGIDWSIFYDYRKETYNLDYLLEISNKNKYRFKKQEENYLF